MLEWQFTKLYFISIRCRKLALLLWNFESIRCITITAEKTMMCSEHLVNTS